MDDHARFCTECGAPLDAADGLCRRCVLPIAEQPLAGSAIEWELAFPLLTNRFFLYDAAKALFWAFAVFDTLVLSIFLVQGETDVVRPFLSVSALILAGFAAAIAAIAIVVFGNRHPTRFRVDKSGCHYAALRGRMGLFNRIGLLLGVAARNPGLAGASILAETQAGGRFGWDEIHGVREYPALGVITLMDSWHVVLRLYCPPDQYSRIAELVRFYSEAAARRRARRSTDPSADRADWRRRALLSAGAGAAAGALASAPVELPIAVPAALLLLGLATVWIPAISRPSGGLLAAGATAAAVMIVRLGTEVVETIPRELLKGGEMPAWAQRSEFDRMNGTEWLLFGLATAGLVVFLALGMAGLTARLHRRE